MNETTSHTRRNILLGAGLLVAGAAVPAGAAVRSEKDWTPAERANVKVVNDFLAAMEQKKPEALVALLAPDAKARMTAHTPQPAMSPEQFKGAIGKFLADGGVQFKVLETHAQGPLVTNVRIDRITAKTGQRDLHYMGVFFLRDGKIAEWSDYEIAPATPVKPGQPL